MAGESTARAVNRLEGLAQRAAGGQPDVSRVDDDGRPPERRQGIGAEALPVSC